MHASKALALASALTLLSGAAPAVSYQLPLQISMDGRRLVDQAGVPFLVNGDAPWSIIVEPTLEEAEQYLEDRRQRGFTLLMVNLIEHHFSSNPPNNRNGDNPFLAPGDFSQPNEAYFAHADAVLSLAEEKGFVVLLTPSYLGWNGGNEGWWAEMNAAGEEVLREYGRWLGQRYREYDNIVWLNGGDFSPPDQTLVHAIAEGILETDDRHLHTVHTGSDESASVTYAGAPWLDINNTYSYMDNLYVYTLGDWNREPFLPFFMIESHYEENWIDPPPERIRRQAWWPMMTGAQGHIMGNFPVWYFGSGWQDSLDSPGAGDMAHLADFFAGIAWWELVPDQDHSFVTAGYGTFSSTDYVTAAVGEDATFAAAYIPPTGTGARSLTLDPSVLDADVVRVRWFNPASGTWHDDPASPMTADGPVMLSTPGSNGEGANDWALFVQRADGDELVVDKLGTSLDFDPARAADKAKLRARAVGFDPGGSLAGTSIVVDIAGATAAAVLDEGGRAKTETLRVRLKNAGVSGWSINLKLQGGEWQDVWNAAGMTDATVRNLELTLPVSVTLAGVTYSANVSVLYSATTGKSGKAKVPR